MAGTGLLWNSVVDMRKFLAIASLALLGFGCGPAPAMTSNSPTVSNGPRTAPAQEPAPAPAPAPAVVPSPEATSASSTAAGTSKRYLTVMAVNNGAGSRYEDNSWERVMMFKGNDVMQIYEVAIWDNGVAGNPNRISLYRFDGTFDPDEPQFAGGGAAWVAYRERYNMLNVQTPPSCKTAQGDAYYACSAAYLDAFEKVFAKIVSDRPAEHYGIRYGGHGSSAGLFENMLSESDSKTFLSYADGLIGKKLDFLDWSTNCDMGNSSVLANEYPYADYIISSDLPRGGFAADWADDYYRLKPEADLGRFFGLSKAIRQSLVEMADSERSFWETETTKNDMIAKRLKQSLSVYDTGEYASLAAAVDLKDMPAGDVLDYIRANHPDQERKFDEFRFHYVSNKDFFRWDQDSNGFKKI